MNIALFIKTCFRVMQVYIQSGNSLANIYICFAFPLHKLKVVCSDLQL